MNVLEKQLFLGVIFAGWDFNIFLTGAFLLKHENAPCTIKKSFELHICSRYKRLFDFM